MLRETGSVRIDEKVRVVIGSYFEPAGATPASGPALAQPLDDLVDAGCGGK
jgi:hypothetical protein